MKYLFSVAAAFALTVPAVAVGQGQSENSQSTDEKGADVSQNRMVCKRQKSTGTRLGSEKVCMTAAQWAQLKRDQREATERTQAARWKSD